jgi:hypothetical protein
MTRYDLHSDANTLEVRNFGNDGDDLTTFGSSIISASGGQTALELGRAKL